MEPKLDEKAGNHPMSHCEKLDDIVLDSERKQRRLRESHQRKREVQKGLTTSIND